MPLNPNAIALKDLFLQHYNSEPTEINQLPLSGSDRIYFRLKDDKGHACIGTYNINKNENNSFFYFARLFNKHQLPVPEVYKSSRDKKYYIQEDVGEESLFDILKKEGFSDKVKSLYKKAIAQLAKFHWDAGREVDYTLCHSSNTFDKNAVMSDLLYFKYYFADILKIEYNKNDFLQEMEIWSKTLASYKPQTFMYRDFQSRNIIVQNEEVFFIDFQGGMLGLPQYDLASLLWQAKAQLPEDWKNELLNYYFTSLKELNDKPNFDENAFRRVYLDCVLLRILQTLGAYGFRGLIEKKPHFISSIQPALIQLNAFIQSWPHILNYNELRKILFELVKPEVIAKFGALDTEPGNDILKIKIYSFSYKKGLPAKEDENGGGFVFDCRGIMNPGRFEEYKQLTGKDAPVINYLSNNTLMPQFLNSIFNTIDITVNNYLQRGFESLQISFGCTGGQHRSVYAAEQMKKYLKSKFNLEAIIIHLEQEDNNITRR